MRKITRIWLLVIGMTLIAPTCALACGRDRWDVKTLKDPQASQINFTPAEKSISDLLELTAPSDHGNRRVPFERQTYRVQGVVVGLMNNNFDSDIHIVIADPDDHHKTMIAEIPLPECANPQYADTFRQARQVLVHDVGYPVPAYQKLSRPIPVEVVGVGFFDREHGEIGQATNGVELHPILSIRRTAGRLEAKGTTPSKRHAIKSLPTEIAESKK